VEYRGNLAFERRTSEGYRVATPSRLPLKRRTYNAEAKKSSAIINHRLKEIYPFRT